jgi:hypothetical protein
MAAKECLVMMMMMMMMVFVSRVERDYFCCCLETRHIVNSRREDPDQQRPSFAFLAWHAFAIQLSSITTRPHA